jgi:hypothetical protein
LWTLGQEALQETVHLAPRQLQAGRSEAGRALAFSQCLDRLESVQLRMLMLIVSGLAIQRAPTVERASMVSQAACSFDLIETFQFGRIGTFQFELSEVILLDPYAMSA